MALSNLLFNSSKIEDFFRACHIPDRRSRVQIGFDQISPLALSTRDLGTRLLF